MQSSLFDDPSQGSAFHQYDLAGVKLDEYPAAFNQQEADEFFKDLLVSVDWQEAQLRIAGKLITVPRLQCWMGDAKSHYGYSGIRLQPVPWSDSVLTVRERVESLTGITFNSVLLNLYRHGNDSVAWHADDEKELGEYPEIASVSFGAKRVFQIRPKDPSRRREKLQLLLHHGSVLHMKKGMQNNWEHQLPKVKDLDKPRINLTFRTILGAC